MVKYSRSNLKIITANIHEPDLEVIAKFIEWGIAASRSDFIRIAVRAQIKKEYKYIEKTDAIRTGEYDHTRFALVPGIKKPFRIVRRLEK